MSPVKLFAACSSCGERAPAPPSASSIGCWPWSTPTIGCAEACAFHAAHTGRWSGRGYQPQNLKRPETKDLDAAVDAVLSGDIARVRELGAPLTIAGDVQRSVICARARA